MMEKKTKKGQRREADRFSSPFSFSLAWSRKDLLLEPSLLTQALARSTSNSPTREIGEGEETKGGNRRAGWLRFFPGEAKRAVAVPNKIARTAGVDPSEWSASPGREAVICVVRGWWVGQDGCS